MAENDANAGGDEIQVGKRSKLPMILAVLGFLIIGIGVGYAVSVVMAPADPAAAEEASKDDVEKEEDGASRHRDDQPR